jgi:hypothetical protein
MLWNTLLTFVAGSSASRVLSSVSACPFVSCVVRWLRVCLCLYVQALCNVPFRGARVHALTDPEACSADDLVNYLLDRKNPVRMQIDMASFLPTAPAI